MALVLAPDPDSILLIRRAERAGDPWSGHVGLPGGRWHHADPDLLATAMREAREEVGLALTRPMLLGQLEPVSPRTRTPTPIVVQPFVFAPNRRPALQLNHEVTSAFWVEVEQLRRPDRYRPISRRVGREEREFPAFHLPDHIVWGLTERILTELLSLPA